MASSTLTELRRAPWWVSLVVGGVAAAATLLVVPVALRSTGGPLGETINLTFGPFVPWAAASIFALCALASIRSALDQRRSARLFADNTRLDQLRDVPWRDFERWVGEAFRRQGYDVRENGLGGPDGGVDLVLHRGGRLTLVQCKRWRGRSVGVTVVREMAGLLSHHDANEVILVTTSGFTADARAFAVGKEISLIDGTQLLGLLGAPTPNPTSPTPVSSAPPRPLEPHPVDARRRPPADDASTDSTSTTAAEAPTCPRCGSGMALRTNRAKGSQFWGCGTFPRCRGTLPVTEV